LVRKIRCGFKMKKISVFTFFNKLFSAGKFLGNTLPTSASRRSSSPALPQSQLIQLHEVDVEQVQLEVAWGEKDHLWEEQVHSGVAEHVLEAGGRLGAGLKSQLGGTSPGGWGRARPRGSAGKNFLFSF
jgi:hypothetical protein